VHLYAQAGLKTTVLARMNEDRLHGNMGCDLVAQQKERRHVCILDYDASCAAANTTIRHCTTAALYRIS
jgi:hypothetical protein